MKRSWIYWLMVAVFLVFVISRLTEARQLARTLSQGDPRWIAVGLGVQIVYYVVFTSLYQSALYTVEVESKLLHLIPVWFTSIFLNITAPSVGVTGAAVFVDDAARRGQSAARAAAGILLVLVADYSAFFVILVAGMAYLFQVHTLRTYEVIAAAILLGFIGGLSGVLLLGLWRPALLRRLLLWIQSVAARLSARFHRRSFLSPNWAETSAAEFSEAAAAMAAHPDRVARTYAAAMVAHVLELTSLWVLFQAFHEPVELGVLVAGYAIGILFWLVAITPSGIGVVEGIMTLVFVSLGVPAAGAALIALSFRGFTFWLPLVIGFLVLRRTRSFRAAKTAGGERV